MNLFKLKTLYLAFLWTGVASKFNNSNVIFAINCGGRAHTDLNGIIYQADYIEEGIASDYGAKYTIARVESHDAILYQTERYSTEDLTYSMPIPTESGTYTLVLKFCEVYFHGADQKVFDVLLNDELVISELDIWKVAGGTGIAYDTHVSFKVKGRTAFVGETVVDISKGLKLTFAKGLSDNPKINAFYLYKGPASDIPNLLDFPPYHDIDDLEDLIDLDKVVDKPKFADGPPVEDPYAVEDGSYLIFPFLVALACFFPLLFCLCKM